jgi:type IX secretion system PorP/SprF family membrane protein
MHFSQFNQNPSLINPALTGVDGLRASLNNRKQWNSLTTPFRTYGVSVEGRNSSVKKKTGGNLENTPPNEKIPGNFAAGLSIYNDRAGDGRLSLTQISLSLATFLKTGEKSEISFGVQTAYATRRIDNGKFIYPNQYNGTTYDPDLNNGENYATDKFRYLDLASGLVWSYNDEERGLKDHRDVNAHLGFSVYHLTTPTQKFLQKKTDALAMKYVSHGDLMVSIRNTRTAIQGSYLLQSQASAIEIVAGAMFRYYMKNGPSSRYTGYGNRNTLAAGFYYRSSDAIIFSTLFEWQEQYAIGLSYDFNVSKLSKASNVRGGLELTLRYTSGHSFLLKKVQ